MDKKPDRRSKRTKTLLKKIFTELLKSTPVQKITVTELCELADINRSTFYKHYFDLYALLEDIEKDCLQQIDLLIDDIMTKPIPPETVSTLILQYILENKELLYLLIYKNKGEDFWNLINQKMFRLFRQKTLQTYFIPKHITENEFEDALLFISYGYYAIYRKWILEGCEKDPASLSRQLTLLSQACLGELLTPIP